MTKNRVQAIIMVVLGLAAVGAMWYLVITVPPQLPCGLGVGHIASNYGEFAQAK